MENLTTTYTPPADYIAQSRARVAPRFAETGRLLAIWKDAYALWQQQPSEENRLAMAQAHKAYKSEQANAFGAAYEAQRQSTGFQQRIA